MTVAITKRAAINSIGEMPLRASLITTKVAPQTTARPRSAHSARARILGGSPGEEGRGGEQNALQAEVATGGAIPLGGRMSAAAVASRADRDGGDAQGERDVGVRGGAVRAGADAEVGIDRADSGEHGGTVVEAARGTAADFADAR